MQTGKSITADEFEEFTRHGQLTNGDNELGPDGFQVSCLLLAARMAMVSWAMLCLRLGLCLSPCLRGGCAGVSFYVCPRVCARECVPARHGCSDYDNQHISTNRK